MRRRRVPRETAELVDALRRHTSLLRDYCVRAFQEGDDRYLGEVAGKLRVLVYESRTNRPLLLNLAGEFGVGTSFVVDGPPGFELEPGIYAGDTVALRDFLRWGAYYATTDAGERFELSKIDVFSLWAQQTGASHEDEALDERLHRLRSSGVHIGGRRAEAQLLMSIARTVLQVAEHVVRTIEAAGEERPTEDPPPTA